MTMKRRLAWYGVLALAMLASIGFIAAERADRPPDPAVAQATADLNIAIALARDVRAELKNQASFDLLAAVIQPNGSVCMTYRGTNSFNAVVPAQAVRPKRGKPYWTSESNGADFRKQWASVCNAGGRDEARMVKRFM